MKNKSYELTLNLELSVDDYITDESRDEVEKEFTEEIYEAICQIFGHLNGGRDIDIRNFEFYAVEN